MLEAERIADQALGFDGGVMVDRKGSVLKSQFFPRFHCLVPTEGRGEGICQQLGPDLTPGVQQARLLRLVCY